jgi:hypothetical protein
LPQSMSVPFHRLKFAAQCRRSGCHRLLVSISPQEWA